mmetsp:Transcript_127074/g.359664  ORF Transcript_127074/g.359664 Transcript_127074/m.359664 type:complete len:342 (+) Transcript_127074:398-1423(+)
MTTNTFWGPREGGQELLQRGRAGDNPGGQAASPPPAASPSPAAGVPRSGCVGGIGPQRQVQEADSLAVPHDALDSGHERLPLLLGEDDLAHLQGLRPDVEDLGLEAVDAGPGDHGAAVRLGPRKDLPDCITDALSPPRRYGPAGLVDVDGGLVLVVSERPAHLGQSGQTAPTVLKLLGELSPRHLPRGVPAAPELLLEGRQSPERDFVGYEFHEVHPESQGAPPGVVLSHHEDVEYLVELVKLAALKVEPGVVLVDGGFVAGLDVGLLLEVGWPHNVQDKLLGRLRDLGVHIVGEAHGPPVEALHLLLQRQVELAYRLAPEHEEGHLCNALQIMAIGRHRV